MTEDVHVIGGGVIGLSIAFRLAQGGARVAVIDSQKRGRATQAAAGMLAPLAESAAAPSIEPLGVPSLLRYPKFVEDVSGAGGCQVALDGPGILRIATTNEAADELCASKERYRTTGLPLNLLPPGAIRDAEPAIMIQGVLALHSPAERHVNPVALACALQAACERLGVAFRHAEVHSLRPKGGRIAAIMTSHGEIACGQVVAASGVWTAALLAPLGLEIPISPVKGQLFHLHPEPLPLNHTIYSHGLYLVPRRVPPGCGELVVGASEEPKAGFDTATTESAIAGLRSGAEVLIPSLSSAPLVAAKAGLRPVTPDRVPLIGRHPNYGNLAIAAGHGRNGILMAPITADFVADLLLNDVPPPALVAPDRFSRKTA